MGKVLDSCWKGATVSSATLRPQDLLPVFIDVIQEVHPQGSKEFTALIIDAPIEFKKNYPDYSVNYPEDDDIAWQTEDFAMWFNESVWEMMIEIAPEGASFGAHEGDGACFGYWTDEPEEVDADEEMGEVAKQESAVQSMTTRDAVKHLIQLQLDEERRHWRESGYPTIHAYIALYKLAQEFEV